MKLLIFSVWLGFFTMPAPVPILNRGSDEVSIATQKSIVLGQPCDRPYVVAIPAPSPQILLQVQQYVPNAFLTNSRLGWYVQAGSFKKRPPADSLSRQLHQHGLDARVAYIPVRCR